MSEGESDFLKFQYTVNNVQNRDKVDALGPDRGFGDTGGPLYPFGILYGDLKVLIFDLAAAAVPRVRATSSC